MTTAQQFDPRRWRGLFVLLLGQFCALLDVSVTNVALPSIGRATGASSSELQWVVSGYVLAFGLMPVIGGRLGDDHGRRRIFIIGVIGFVIASATVGLSPDPILIIVARVIQGLFGGIVGPQISGYIQSAFPRTERGRAFGGLGVTVGVATALGPVVGGLLIGLGGDQFGWRLVFFINVPIGIVAVILAMAWVKKFEPAPGKSPSRLDVPGVALLGFTILLVLFPAVELDTFHSGWLFLLVIPAGVLLFAFIRRESRLTREHREPLLDLRLFAKPSFSFGTAFILLYFCGFTGLPLVLSLYYQQGAGFSALQAGLGVSAFALGSAIAAPIAGRLVGRLGRPLVVVGVSVFMLSSITIGIVVGSDRGLTDPTEIILRLVVPLFFLGIGGGAVITPNQTLSLTDVDPAIGGSAGGVLQTSQRVGSAIGQAAIGATFFAAVGGATASSVPGHPAAHPEAFAGALTVSIFAAVAFSVLALSLGITDAAIGHRRKSRQPGGQPGGQPGDQPAV
jgi:EmrB/QacA subfamily drug resistance transporter